MLSIKEKGYLLNIIKHCEKINEKMINLTRDQFDRDDDVAQIICFNILQIDELAKNLVPEFIKEYNEIPWHQIKAMRNKVAHGYGTIDMDVIWDTALNSINQLLDYCNKIIKQNN